MSTIIRGHDTRFCGWRSVLREPSGPASSATASGTRIATAPCGRREKRALLAEAFRKIRNERIKYQHTNISTKKWKIQLEYQKSVMFCACSLECSILENSMFRNVFFASHFNNPSLNEGEASLPRSAEKAKKHEKEYSGCDCDLTSELKRIQIVKTKTQYARRVPPLRSGTGSRGLIQEKTKRKQKSTNVKKYYPEPREAE